MKVQIPLLILFYKSGKQFVLQLKKFPDFSTLLFLCSFKLRISLVFGRWLALPSVLRGHSILESWQLLWQPRWRLLSGLHLLWVRLLDHKILLGWVVEEGRLYCISLKRWLSGKGFPVVGSNFDGFINLVPELHKHGVFKAPGVQMG